MTLSSNKVSSSNDGPLKNSNGGSSGGSNHSDGSVFYESGSGGGSGPPTNGHLKNVAADGGNGNVLPMKKPISVLGILNDASSSAHEENFAVGGAVAAENFNTSELFSKPKGKGNPRQKRVKLYNPVKNILKKKYNIYLILKIIKFLIGSDGTPLSPNPPSQRDCVNACT